MEIAELIKFDPYMHFGKDLLHKVYEKNEQLSEDLLWDISLQYPMMESYFSDIFEVGIRYV